LLFAIILLSFFISRDLAAHQDLSWVHNLNNLEKKAIESGQSEASQFLESLTKTKSSLKSCSSAQGTEKLDSNHKIYKPLLIFVSFSMPISTLKSLSRDAQKLGGTLVLRGLIQGSFKETQKKLVDLKEPLIIDPELFKTYGVTTVPAFVHLSEMGERVKSGVPFDKISGNISLDYAIEQFKKEGEIPW
jgi:type-F conjugative transfer system pilin assembly protein TrbC